MFFPALHTKVFFGTLRWLFSEYLRARDNSSIKIQVRPLQSAEFSRLTLSYLLDRKGETDQPREQKENKRAHTCTHTSAN